MVWRHKKIVVSLLKRENESVSTILELWLYFQDHLITNSNPSTDWKLCYRCHQAHFSLIYPTQLFQWNVLAGWKWVGYICYKSVFIHFRVFSCVKWINSHKFYRKTLDDDTYLSHLIYIVKYLIKKSKISHMIYTPHL